MASAAQVCANRENAQKSTGPSSEAGKQTSSQNNFRHGLTGHAFVVLDCENIEMFDLLHKALRDEYKPATPTEQILVEKMAQHHWLSQRAQMLQTFEMRRNPFDLKVQKALANFARYETMHDRLFQRALHDLLKLRAERHKEQIGFESQKRAEANETRNTETHKLKISILETKLEREVIHTNKLKATVPARSEPDIEANTRAMAA